MIIELFFFHGIKFALLIVQSLMCIFVIHFQSTGEANELSTWDPWNRKSSFMFTGLEYAECKRSY